MGESALGQLAQKGFTVDDMGGRGSTFLGDEVIDQFTEPLDYSRFLDIFAINEARINPPFPTKEQANVDWLLTLKVRYVTNY